MKTFPLKHKRLIVSMLLFLCAIVLTGCDQNPNPEVNSPQSFVRKPIAEPPSGVIPMEIASGQTHFAFGDETVIEIESGDTVELPVRFTPVYEPISSVQIGLFFDPNIFTVDTIVPGEGVRPFYTNIDHENGILSFVAGTDASRFGADQIAFTLQLQSKTDASAGESVVTFIPHEMAALLPDVANTDTAVLDPLPKQRVFLRSPSES